jgi:deaminated glutathione amidase
MTRDAVAIAVAQFAPSADEAANLLTIRDLTARAVARGAKIVLFPEYASYFVDPFDDSLAAHAQDVDGPFV